MCFPIDSKFKLYLEISLFLITKRQSLIKQKLLLKICAMKLELLNDKWNFGNGSFRCKCVKQSLQQLSKNNYKQFRNYESIDEIEKKVILRYVIM